MIGFYYAQMVVQSPDRQSRSAKEQCRKAAEAYVDAAECFAPDDELYIGE